MAHQSLVSTRAAADPRLEELELATAAPLERLAQFYGKALGLPVAHQSAGKLTVATGASRLTFVPATAPDPAPFHHFAFNIPENKIVAARVWQLARTALLSIPDRLRDPSMPPEVVDYRHWNAHSIFFLDPGGNVVEYIARHDLRNPSPGPFTPADILYASEIGLIVDDVAAAVSVVTAWTGLDVYRGASEVFTALGDEHGLVLIMKRGRILDFQPDSQEKAARVFPTALRLRGSRPASRQLEGYPYQLVVEA